MFENRIFRFVLFGVTALGTLLFTIGIFAPGWEVTHKGVTQKGIWFMMTCIESKPCKYHTYLEKYLLEKSQPHFQWYHEYEYSTAVGNQVLALISLLTLYGATVLTFVVAFYEKGNHLAASIATPLFLISGCLIWTHIGQEAATIKAKNLVYSPEMMEHQLSPYAIVITALGSAITIIVGFIYFFFSVLHLRKLPQTNYEQFS